MAELNMNQIIEKLNVEFAGEARKIVFWYDDNGDFADDIDSIRLENAKVYRLTPTNQFRTKLILERMDKTGNYLIYAPFHEPDVKQNHLKDTLLYSKRFYADRASLICADLGIQEKYKPIIQKHIKYFGDKKRTQRFYDFEIENFTEETIELALMSAVCQTKIVSFEEVARLLLTDGGLTDNKYLVEFERYDLLNAFWKQCENSFGYKDNTPTLEKLVRTLFVTYTERTVTCELPSSWKSFVTYKAGNIMVFLDSLKNNKMYSESYDKLSKHVENSLDAERTFAILPTDSIVDCDTFLCMDQLIIEWLRDRLCDENTGAMLNGLTIPEVCQLRQKKHYAEKLKNTYVFLEAAWHLISIVDYQPKKCIKDIQNQYITEDYRIDKWYRCFIYNLDPIENRDKFDKLCGLVENIYTNEYLCKLLPAWNRALTSEKEYDGIPLQVGFYGTRVRNIKERVVVIISDAMRFEVGKELEEKLKQDPDCKISFGAQLSVLPSYTALGMAALLPHKKLTMTDGYKILIDGNATDDIPARAKILKSNQSQGDCIQFDDLKQSVTEIRNKLTGKQVVYVYHNQIDARGETARTEKEVFNACSDAVCEIDKMIHRISTCGNTHRFLITADHGFLYKREPLTESDKICKKTNKTAFSNRRFIIDKTAIEEDGVAHISLGDVLGNSDERVVSFPIGPNVFKTSGGMNYVHGGSSPQEMIVPILDIKMERIHTETRTVGIKLISIVRKITNLNTVLDFIQNEAVSSSVKETNYRIYFVSEDNERITNENIMIADSKSNDPKERIRHFRFMFKNKKYNSRKHYFLVIEDMQMDNEEVFRQEVTIDIAFPEKFGIV